MFCSKKKILSRSLFRLKREEETLLTVKQYYVECYTLGQKYVSIRNIYGVLSIGQVIIFCRTKKTAAWLGQRMGEDGHSVAYLSADLVIKERLRVLKSFREGNEKVRRAFLQPFFPAKSSGKLFIKNLFFLNVLIQNRHKMLKCMR